MRKVFAAYKKLMGALYSLIRTCIAVILIVMVCVTFMEVIRRYIFGLSFIWAEELVRFLLVATSFFGGAAAYRAGALACLDLVTSHLSERIKKAIDIVVTILIIGVCIYLCIQGYTYSFTPQIANMYSTGLKLKMTYIYLSIPIGFTLLILFAIEHLFDAFSSDLTPKNTKSEGKES